MITFVCQIHNCRFGIEAKPEADESVKKACTWTDCPICRREEQSRLREQLAAMSNQNKHLLAAIKIKLEHLQTQEKKP